MHCPTCAAAYPPGTRFCPADGTPLVDGAPRTALDALAALADSPAAPASPPLPVPPPMPATAPAAAPARTSRAALAAVGVLGGAVLALAALLVLRPAAPTPETPAPIPAAVAPAEPVASNEAMTDAQTAPGPEPLHTPADRRTVSTPTDGFLSIRSAPDGRGTRLDRMLDGETVDVLSCGPPRVVDKDPGHWCRVRRQSGQTGWAYDAYLVVYDDVAM